MGIGDKLLDTISGAFNSVIKGLIDVFKPSIVKDIKKETVEHSIDPNMIEDPDLKEQVKKLKEAWKHSPESITDIGNDLFNVFIGKAAKMQFDGIMGDPGSTSENYMERVFHQMAIIRDLSLICGIYEIIGSAVPFTNLQHLGLALRHQMDALGITQITGYGYGQILANSLGPVLTKELNRKYQPTPIDADSALRSYWRGIRSESQYLYEMSLLGYTEENAMQYGEVRLYYPSPQDFIRFAVRETFRPEIVKKYGYDTDFPTDILPYSGKAGIETEKMKWYWRAHWELPSAQMGYEMLHRELIDKTDLETLLKIGDMAPYWVDKVIGISWSPYTRVDARRMYDLGVLNDEEYLKALREIGFDHDKAAKMLEWTKLYVQDPEKQLTRSQIENLYKRGLQSREETIAHLGVLGYHDTVASLILELIDAKEATDDLKEFIEVQTHLYATGQIVSGLFTSRLIDREIDPDKVKYYLFKAQVKRSKRVKLPSKEDLDRWLESDIITVSKWEEGLSNLGYNAENRDNYREELGL